MARLPDHVRNELKAALARAVEDIFERHGARFRGQGRNRRTSTCPLRAEPHSRWDAVRVTADGLWRCEPCGKGGDVFHALAGFLNLDAEKDFPERARAGAELIGFVLEEPADPAEARRRREAFEKAHAERAAARRDREEREAREVAAAIVDAGKLWPRLPTRSEAGEAYLRGRQLDTEVLIRAGAVRFGRCGDPTVALHDVAGGVVNVVRRVIEPGDFKALGRPRCPNDGTLVGKVTSIEKGSTVVVCEGVVDSLTALLAWPGSVALGAHGAPQYGGVVAMAARRLVKVGGGRLLLAVDHDDAGDKAYQAGILAILEAELDLDSVEVAEIGTHHDLNDAWRAGWRP
jgi:hypothetical protein